MTYRNAWLPEVFNDFFDTENMPKANATAPAINVKETPSEYVVEMAAPGMRKEDFGVHINNDGDLTVKMECKRNEKEEKPCHYLRREFAYSKFEKTLIMPDAGDRHMSAAKGEHGVLNVHLPMLKREEQKVSRHIEIG